MTVVTLALWILSGGFSGRYAAVEQCGGTTRTYPFDEPGDRYARSDIDEAAFEQRLEAVLETEEVRGDDVVPVVCPFEHPDATDRAGSGDLHLPRE